MSGDAKRSNSSTTPAKSEQPTSTEVVATYQKLLAQTKTPKVSTWSVRTLDRAIGWATLAERARKWPEGEGPKQCLLSSLMCNPLCPPGLRDNCAQYLRNLSIGSDVLNTVEAAFKDAQETCSTELPRKLARLGISEEEIVRRAAARHLYDRCRADAAVGQSVRARSLSGHAWSLEALVRIAALNRSDADWVLDALEQSGCDVRERIDAGLFAHACNKNVRFAAIFSKGASSK